MFFSRHDAQTGPGVEGVTGLKQLGCKVTHLLLSLRMLGAIPALCSVTDMDITLCLSWKRFILSVINRNANVLRFK